MVQRRNLWVAGGLLVAIAFLIPTMFLRAQEASVTTVASAEEEVVTQPTDEPLVRQAKLRRAWNVYREVGTTDIYAITKAKTKRAVKTLDFFTAFNANYHIHLVASGRLANFTTGEPITSIDGLNPEDFVKAPPRARLIKVKGKPAVYLITPNGRRRVIIAEGVFHRFGWEFRDVEEVSESELNSYLEDTSVTDSTVFEEEINVQSTEQRLQREQLNKRLQLKGRTVVRARLVKAIGDPNIYVIDGQGRKHRIASEAAARRRGLDLKVTTEVTTEELAAFPDGPEITETSASVNLNEVVQ